MPSRRELIAAALVAPVAACTSTPAIASGSAWTDAMQLFNKARAAEVAHDRAVWHPAYEAHKAGGPLPPDHVDDDANRLTDARCDAEDALIATPAPALSAVIWKIEYARERWVDFSDWPDDWWAAVMSDLHRMDGRA